MNFLYRTFYIIFEQVIQDRQTIKRDLRTMQKKHHRTEVRLRGSLKNMAKDNELRQTKEAVDMYM